MEVGTLLKKVVELKYVQCSDAFRLNKITKESITPIINT